MMYYKHHVHTCTLDREIFAGCVSGENKTREKFPMRITSVKFFAARRKLNTRIFLLRKKYMRKFPDLRYTSSECFIFHHSTRSIHIPYLRTCTLWCWKYILVRGVYNIVLEAYQVCVCARMCVLFTSVCLQLQ